MGNLCKGQTGVGDNGGKPPSQRNGSGSTSKFSPTDDYHNGDKTGAGASASRSREAGLGVPESVLERVPRHNHAATAGEVNAKVPSAHVDINYRSDLNTHSAKEGGAAASESKGKSTSKSSKGKKGGYHRRSREDKGDRKPRPERSDEDKTTKRRDRKSRANGDHETDEDRERREKKDKERRERRKRKEAKAAADMVGGETGVTNGQPSAEQSLADSGIQGSSDGRRESKSTRNKGSDGTDARNNGSGSHGASGVMAGSGASATGGSSVVTAVDDRKNKKGPSYFRKIYDSLTLRFSAGGGGGGGTSSVESSKSDRRPGRNQLVTSAISRDVRDKYEIECSVLGRGSYGVVRRCWDKETRESFAIKTIEKRKVKHVDSLRREIEILRCVDHPCIIKLYDAYEDDWCIHLVTELCTGGELFDRIIEKSESEERHYSEEDAKVVVARILNGIEYCHVVHNICHRDLKPENFLFKWPDCDMNMKIIDFGLSRFEDAQSPMTTCAGTAYYMAPEVLSRKYDKACDLWSIGVITYILLAGYPPFYGDSTPEIFASIRHGYFEFPSPEWDNISMEAKDFITQLLQKDPSARMTASEALDHCWVNSPPRRRGTASSNMEFGVPQDKRDLMNNQLHLSEVVFFGS